MTAWNPEHYLRFADERTRPVHDLVARIALDAPAEIADLGCGPGNSTAVLHARWPQARLRGLDASSEMIARARTTPTPAQWAEADVSTWIPERPLPLVFSNALLHWIGDHERLVPRLFEQVAAGGALAFQVPSGAQAPVRRHIRELAEEPQWRERLAGTSRVLNLKEPGFYYDLLAPRSQRLDLWETEYQHVLEGPEDVVAWIASTGLRPCLEALADDAERAAFKRRLEALVADSYPRRADGKLLFPFRRLFVIAYA